MERIDTNNLDQIFDLEESPKEIVLQKQTENFSEDIDAVKKVHYDLIQKSQDALDNLLDFAKASESPRAYEVVANLIKTTADVAKNLADISTKEAKSKPDATINNTQNNVFMTTTADLQKLLRGEKLDDR